MARIEDLIFENGERYPILLKADELPDFWVTLYVTENLRSTHTQSSITNIINHLIHLKLWEEVNSRDLVEEFRQSIFLKDEDILAIRNHCMLETRSLKKWLQPSRKNVVKFASASTASFMPLQTVSTNHAYNRMTYIAKFLDFTARAVLKNKLIDQSVTDSISKMSSQLIAHRPKGITRASLVGDPDAKAPSPKAFERILEITREDAPDNPFKSSGIRFRNALIFDVMDATGMRPGELLALQISDITYQKGDFQKPIIRVEIRHDAVEDDRPKQPVAKTLPRSILITPTLKERLNDYIMNVRANIAPARKHPYVFVTHKHGKYLGKPISNSTFINRVLKPAIAVSPELLEEITRHGFRHYFNYKLSKRIDKINKKAKTDPNTKPITEGMETKIRQRLMGWRSAQSAKPYIVRYVKEEADRIMLEDMDHHSKSIKKDN